MSYIIKLKLSPVPNLADARFAAAAGIDYIGFCFDPNNPDFIAPIKAKEIMDWTSGPLSVAEFGNQFLSEIIEISALLNMDVVALNNKIVPDELKQIGKPIIKVIDLDTMDLDAARIEIKTFESFVFAFQLTGKWDWTEHQKQLQQITLPYKIIWNLSANIRNIKTIIETFKPYAINLSAGIEEKTGMKDFDELYDLLDELVG